ncbi:putative porin [Filimonas effusa]|uniref:Porin n=1 Tax=Filimonas effusa TaxID=2508721 RepID=A0A4Q1D078_9BACT|nr:putative porin [Filimonas effusa]RXK80581.1 hypothetical protein ESB13_23390 [Filimonas effusa]
MSYRSLFSFLCCLIITVVMGQTVNAQVLNPTNMGTVGRDTANFTYDSQGRPMRKNKGADSLQHRDPLEDSITISFRFFDSTRVRKLDSSLNDFTTRLPLPYYYQDIGNFGAASRSLIFKPLMKPGFDAGFHAFDIYQLKVEDTRFYQTTRPYTELGYLLGSKSEQFINVTHTQNRGPNLNFAFDIRLITSQGNFKNQGTNHSSSRFNLWRQSKNKRYTSYLIYISNSIEAAENGGLQHDSSIDTLAKQTISDPILLDVRLGNSGTTRRSSGMFGGGGERFIAYSAYSNKTILYRHMYDLGQKDSLVTDSSIVRLFYPRIRLQHTLTYNTSAYTYRDSRPEPANYLNYFNMLVTSDVIQYKDTWKDLTNEFAVISFPEKNNLNQFLKLGAGYQMLKGEFLYYNGDTTFGDNFNNVYLTGEYRNRTRNQRWDLEANGKLYATGPYSGDYSALISLKGVLKQNKGALQIGFQNVNRSPSFVYENRSAFPSLAASGFGKENITRLFANIDIAALQLKLYGNYYLVTNYTYFDSFLTAKQQSALFNVLHIGAEKRFKLSRFWNWYSEVHLQQKTGSAPVNMPLILTRNRLVFEGNFYKNLFVATGLELRYYLKYKADNYSPFTGQFFYQDQQTISNRPDMNLFLHFRIKSFKGFVRLENVNTLNTDGFSFSKYNFAAPNYATRPLWTHIGIWWSFVN